MQQIPYTIHIIDDIVLADDDNIKDFDNAMRFKAWAISNKFRLGKDKMKAMYKEEREQYYDEIMDGKIFIMHATTQADKMSASDILIELGLYGDMPHPSLISPGEVTGISINHIITLITPVGLVLTLVPEMVKNLFPWIPRIYTLRPMAYMLANEKTSERYSD